MANLAGILASIGRGGLQFMLIIWLQGIWLPLHGYSYEDTPLWAGIYLLPLTVGFLISGPLSGILSDRWGTRGLATSGLLLSAATFVALLLIPVNFAYPVFAIITFLNGVGSGMFGAPNRATIMSSVPANQRGSASGMAGTVLNAGSSLSIGIFFSLMVAGLAGSLPQAMRAGLTAHHVPAQAADAVANIPPVGSLFAAFLGYNPIETLLGPTGILKAIPAADAADAHRQGVLPEPDRRPVPRRARHRVHRRGGHVRDRRDRDPRRRRAGEARTAVADDRRGRGRRGGAGAGRRRVRPPGGRRARRARRPRGGGGARRRRSASRHRRRSLRRGGSGGHGPGARRAAGVRRRQPEPPAPAAGRRADPRRRLRPRVASTGSARSGPGELARIEGIAAPGHDPAASASWSTAGSSRASADPDDGRSQLIRLTDGRASPRSRRRGRARAAGVAAILAEVAPEDRAVLERAVTVLEAALLRTTPAPARTA